MLFISNVFVLIENVFVLIENVFVLIENVIVWVANEKGGKGEIDPSETFPNKNDLPCQEINGTREKWL